MVPGDVPPKLIPQVLTNISKPLADIFNTVLDTDWPSQWKTEYQTVIPKKNNPSDLNECRNLSCTNFFSKVLESLILDCLMQEVTLSKDQFGGLKGCGTNHFLLLMWHNLLSGLEEEGSAVSLMAVDFSKAFNRMGHQACLQALAAKNCSNQTLAFIYRFLSNRIMHIKCGNKLSLPRAVTGGSPQGTKLGNFLFCCTLEYMNEQELLNLSDQIYDTTLGTLPPSPTPTSPNSPENAIPPEYARAAFSTPNLNEEINSNFFKTTSGTRNKRNIIRDSILEDSYNIQGRQLNSWSLMYVDDLNVGEVHALETAQRHFTQKKEEKYVHARHCEKVFNIIGSNASKIGMKINAEKTQLLCVSSDNHANVTSHIVNEERKFESVQSMKILEFIFGTKPNVSEHVNYMMEKFNRVIWQLIHLQRANIEKKTMLEVYKVMLRPFLEYCAPIFHPMLSGEQSERIERQQKKALKIVLGFGKTYEELLEEANIERLSVRRVHSCTEFAIKMQQSRRFSYLFPENIYPEDMAELRNTKKYREDFARSKRLYNSPLFTMRRILNDL